jgi:hypothetical protein
MDQGVVVVSDLGVLVSEGLMLGMVVTPELMGFRIQVVVVVVVPLPIPLTLVFLYPVVTAVPGL